MSPLALLEPPKHHLCGLSVSLVATELELLRASYHGCSYSSTELETRLLEASGDSAYWPPESKECWAMS